MSDPNWAPARRLAGDYSDDDGQVIGSLVTTEAAPPDPFPAAATLIPAPSPAPKRPSRMLAGFFTLDANSGLGAQQVLTEDLDRESLTVRVKRVNGAAGVAFLLVAEERSRMTVARPDGTVPNFGEGCRVYEGGSFDAGTHTGAVWIALGAPLTGADQLVVTWSAVTA